MYNHLISEQKESHLECCSGKKESIGKTYNLNGL